jgi:hypothetical protein
LKRFTPAKLRSLGRLFIQSDSIFIRAKQGRLLMVCT